MAAPGQGHIVETEWLAQHLSAPDLVVLDASWYLPQQKRDPRKEYAEARIPGALFFDIEDLSDEKSDLPHMLPSTVKFSSRMTEMGVGDGTRVVVYDSSGILSAPRAWWMLRVMGHQDVAVLNGGLPKWRAEMRPVDDGPPRKRARAHFTPKFNAALLAELDDIRNYIDNGGVQIVDARSAARFSGEQPEPRPGLTMGHMPGAINVPFPKVLNAAGTMKSVEEIREAFEASGVDLKKPIATTCGSGVTASILTLALAALGRADVSVYDGSWAEWGRPDADLPFEQGS